MTSPAAFNAGEDVEIPAVPVAGRGFDVHCRLPVC